MTPIPLTETQVAELFRLRSENAALKEQLKEIGVITLRAENAAPTDAVNWKCPRSLESVISQEI